MTYKNRREFLSLCLKGGVSMAALTSMQLKAMTSLATPAASADGFKALVCIFLKGGNDSFNMLIPQQGDPLAAYLNSRQNLAVSDSIAIDPVTAVDGGIGLNRALSPIAPLFNNQKLAVVSGVGRLVAPITLEQYKAKSAAIPNNLFSHNDQQATWMQGREKESINYGWGGRILELLNQHDSFGSNISLSGNNLWQTGPNAIPFAMNKSGITRVNAYNSTLLHAWAANIDIQYVLDPYACAIHIVSYISKSQRGMSDLLNRAAKEAREGNLDIKRQVRHIGNHFLNSVEVGAQEAAYLVLQMPLTKASRDVVFINTSPSDDRVILIKTDAELEKLTPNSTDVECSNVIKRYAKRPKQLENWCLADYVSQLDVVFPKESENTFDQTEINDDENDESDVDFNESDTLVTLKNGIIIRRRKVPRVITYVRFSLKTDPENYYREKLMLFMPWRDESVDLLSGTDTFENSSSRRKSFLAHKIKQYEFNAEL